MRTAFFPPKTLHHLPADNLEALAVLCGEFDRFDGHSRQLPEHHDDYVEALGIIKGFAIAREAPLEQFPEIGSDRHHNIASINTYFKQLRGSVRAELTKRHSRGYFEAKTEEYASLFSQAAFYEFGETEFNRLQTLITELRNLIGTSALISEEHKRRLLRKLEAMRNELHRKTGDIDRFWSFLGEAGIAMRKFGEDLGPVSEKVLELGRIIIAVVFAKEGIKALPEVSQILVAQES